MDPNAVGTGAAAIAASGTKEWLMSSLGGLLIVGALLVLVISNTSNIANDTVKENYNLGGSIGLIVGVAILFQSFGWFTKIAQAASADERRKAIATIFIVLLTTIAIFTALFFNYAKSETVSFATGILAVLIVVVIFAVLYNFSGKIPIANLISRSLLILFYFMPYAFFTFGILTDIITRQLQFTGASFAGFTAVLFNYAISLTFTKGETPEVSNALCEIPGLSFLTSAIAPQSMVSVLSTIAYIATYISRSTPGQGFAVSADYRWPSWVLFFGVAGLQTAILSTNGCLAVKEGDVYTSGLYKPLVAMLGSLFYGGIMGLIGFEVLEKRADTTGATNAGGSPVLGAGVNANLVIKTPDVGTCAAGSSDGEFICESFENGKLKRRVMTE
jgi:hypothetical protein